MKGTNPSDMRNDIKQSQLLLAALFALLLLLPTPSSAFVNGGDQISVFRNVSSSLGRMPGKQEPVASVMDSLGNTIITGYQTLPGSATTECYTVKVSPGGAPIWRKAYKIPNFDVSPKAVAVDGDGNVYVTGVISYPSPMVFTLRYDSAQSGSDPYSASGWSQTFNGVVAGADSLATSISIHKDHPEGSDYHVYVGGSSVYSGKKCIMLLKYKCSDGTPAWQLPTALNNTQGQVESIVVDVAQGILAVTGQVQSADQTQQYFKTVQYDLSGSPVRSWQYAIASPPVGYSYNDSGLYVGLDSQGHIVATGYSGNSNATIGLSKNIYTVKYCTSSAGPCSGKNAGDKLWEQIYLNNDAQPKGLYIDKADDSVYITGSALDSDYKYRIYTARYNAAVSTPQKSWDALFSSGSNNMDIPAAIIGSSISGQDNLFVTGSSTYPGAGVTNIVRFRTIKYRKSTGYQLWTSDFHGVADLYSKAVGIGLDATGQPYVAGFVNETGPLGSSHTTAASTVSEKLLRDGSISWNDDLWKNYYIMMTSGSSSGLFQRITANSKTNYTFTLFNGIATANGDNYYIFDQDDYDYYVVKYERGELETPSNLTATAASNNSISLTWQDNNTATPTHYFRVERCATPGDHVTACDFTNPDVVSGVISISVVSGKTIVSLTDTGLAPDKYYFYRVKAYTGPDNVFGNATLVTYPSNTAHAITQLVSSTTIADPTPGYTYRYNGVANSEDYALAITTSPVDGNPLVTGRSIAVHNGNAGDLDYYTIKMDRGNMSKLWSQRYNSDDQTDVAACVAVDKNNQVIVSGRSWLYDPGISGYAESMYTIKYKSNPASDPTTGQEQWEHQYNGPGSSDHGSEGIAMAVDTNNNVAVIGRGINAAINYDIYLLYYPSGTPGGPTAGGYWEKRIDNGADDEPIAVAFDPQGNVIVTGFTKNTTGGRIDYDIYTAKFAASNGTLLWSHTFDGVNEGGIGGSVHYDDEANDLTVDEQGNIYVAGYMTNAQGNTDFITIKYDANGLLQWHREYNGPAGGNDEAVSVKYDPIDKTVVVGGNQLTDTGNHDIHLIRYYTSDRTLNSGTTVNAGDVAWQKTLLREASDEDMSEMTLDRSGNVYITAKTTDAGENQDILAFKVDWQGNIIGNTTLYGAANTTDRPYGIAANYLGEIFVAGMTQSGSNADYIVLKIDGDALQVPTITSASSTYTATTLNWSNNSRQSDGFQVARKDGACPSFDYDWNGITPVNLGIGTLTWGETGLASNTSYCYGLRAKNGSTYSRWMNTTITTGTPPEPVVARLNSNQTAETGYGAVATGTTSVLLTWGIPAYITAPTGFVVDRCSAGPSCLTTFVSDGNPFPTTVSGATATSYTDTSACPGISYYYRVQAKNTTAGAVWSSAFSATTWVMLPTVDNPIMDGDFEGSDPAMTWWGRVGSNPPYFYGGTVGVDGSHPKALMFNIDNSAVTGGSSIWKNILTAPTAITTNLSATVTGSTLNDGSPFQSLGDGSGWKSRKLISVTTPAVLAVNTLYAIAIPRNSAITDGSEPQVNFQDVRIYDSIGHAELPCLLVSGSITSTTFWFKTPSNATGIYVYYGNATAAQGSNMTVARQLVGRRQPVLTRAGGRYTITAAMKANLTVGALSVNLGSQAITSSNQTVIDHNPAGFNNSFNNNAWHDTASGDKLSMDAASTLTGTNSLRAYINRSTADTNVPQYYPQGSGSVDDITMTPYYNLTATRVSENQINIAWAASAYDETGYKIQRCSTTDGSVCDPSGAAPITLPTSGVSTYSDTGLTQGFTYTYRVYPYKTSANTCSATPGWSGGWTGTPSNTVTVTATTITAPSTLAATAPNTTQVNLTWLDNTLSETGFQLERCLASSCTYSPVTANSIPANTTSFNDTGGCNNTAYNYRIKAVNSGKLSGDGGGTWGNKATLNFGSSFIANFITKMTLTASQLGGSDATIFNSLRFFDSTATQELPYWIQGITGSGVSATATVWFKSGANNSIDIYSNNPSAGPVSNTNWLFGPGLAGFWPFNETGTSDTNQSVNHVTLDQSGGGMNGTLVGTAGVNSAAVVSDTSYYGTSNVLSLDGLTGYVRVDDYANSSLDIGPVTGSLDGSITVELWYYCPADAPHNSYIFSKPYDGGGAPWYTYELSLYDTNGAASNGNKYVNFGVVQTTAVTSATSPNLLIGQWNHIAGRYDRTRGEISSFVNGVKTVTPINTPFITIRTNDEALGIGQRGIYGNIVKGKLDDVRVYNRALNDQEITAHYAASLPAVISLINVQSSPAQPTTSAGWTETAYSTPTSITTPAKPAAPTVPAAAVLNESQINVTWTFTTTDQTGFHIDRCTDATCTTIQKTIDVPSASPRASLDTDLIYGTQYWYRIRAYKNASCGWETVNSTIVTATTKSMTTAKPTGLAGANSAATVVTNCDDIRITDSDGTTVLPLYIQNKYQITNKCGTSTTMVITKIPSIPVNASATQKYYVYYGNPSAPNTADGNKVFEFNDDFDGNAIDTTKWTITDGTGFSIANNSSKLTGTNTTGRLTSKKTFGAGYNLQANVQATSLPASNFNGFVPVGVYNSASDNFGYLLGSATATDPPNAYYSINGAYTYNSVSTQILTRTTSTPAIIDTHQFWYNLPIYSDSLRISPRWRDIDSSWAMYYTGSAPVYSVPAFGSRPIVIGRRYDSDSYNNQTYSANWEWVHVSKAVSTDTGTDAPSSSVGSLDTVGAPYTLTGQTGSWLYRKPITISRTTNSVGLIDPLVDYQQSFNIDTSPATSTFPLTDHITLTWTDTTATEEGFYIYRCSGPACTPTVLFATIGPMFGTGATVSYTDGATASNTNYCYKVAAFSTANSWTTDIASQTAVCKTTFNQQAPANLAGIASGSQVGLTWDDKSIGETGYKLERCTGSGCTFTTLDILDGTNPYKLLPPVSNTKNDGVTTVASVAAGSADPPNIGYSDGTVGCAGTFRYRISAYFQNDSSNILGPSVATGNIVVGAAPTAPTLSGTATYPNEQQIKITWTDANAVGVWNSFIVERCTATSGSCSNGFMQVGAITGTRVLNYTDTTIVPGVQYGYRVSTTITSACGIVRSTASAVTAYGATTVNPTQVNYKYSTPPQPWPVYKTDLTNTKLNLYTSTATEQNYVYKRCAGINCTDFSFLAAVNPVDAYNQWLYYTDSTVCPGNAYTYSIVAAEYPQGMPILSNNGANYLWMSARPLFFSNFAISGVAQVTITKDLTKLDGSEPKADFSDIRFYDTVAKTELQYTIQSIQSIDVNTTSATVNLKTGSTPINVLTITNGGTGYTTAPTVSFTGGGGTGAAATATVTGGIVTALTITNVGSGYTSTPTVGFTGGGGSGAAATATSVPQIYLYYGNANAALSVNNVAIYVTPDMAGNNTTLGLQVKATVNTVTAVIPGLLNAINDWNFVTNAWTQWGTGYFNSDSNTRLTGTSTRYVTAVSMGNTGYTLPSVPVVPGAQYQLKAYLKTALTQGWAKCDVTNAAAGFTSTVTNVKVTGTQDWAELPVDTITIPGNVSTVDVRCYIDTSPVGTAYFGAVQLLATGNPLVLSATAFDESTIDVGWNDFFGGTAVSGSQLYYGSAATGYNIYGCTDSSGASCTLLPSPAAPYLIANGTGTSYRVSGLTPGASYYYRVAAYRSGSQTCSGNGNDPSNSIAWRVYSNVASATTTNGKPVSPAAAPLSSTSMQVTWPDKSSGETDYDVYRCDGGGACAYAYKSRVPSNHNADQSIMASYALDGTASTLTDRSVYARNLTPSGTPTYDDGGFNLNSATLSKTNDSNINNSTFTLEFDYKFYQNIYGGQTILYLYPSSTSAGEQHFYIKTASTPSHRFDFLNYDYVSWQWVTVLGNVGINGVNGNDFSPGRWYRIKIVRNGTRLTVYVDGIQVATTNSAPVPIPPTAYYMYVGQNNVSYYQGVIKNLIYYNSAVIDPSLVSYTDTTVCPGTTYQYKVAPYKAGWPQLGSAAGELVLSDATTSAVTPAFLPPTGVIAKTWPDAANRIDLSWTQPASTNNQSSFLAKECPGANCSTPFSITSASATFFSRTGLAPETSYCYQIASYAAPPACNNAGVTSAYTSASCAETAMNPPSGLGFEIPGGVPTYSTTTGTSKYPYKVHLKWNDNTTEENYYEIQVQIKNGSWVLVGTVSAAEYIDTIGIEPVKTYTYRVRGFRANDNTESPASNIITVTTPAFNVPTAPDHGTCICTTDGSGKQVCN
ncbi:MAG TPA: DUF2341 domain-containing protein [Desulfuromonadaceae bacterium]|jgi:hypothetical protein